MPETTEYKNVILTIDGAAATVQFNRPHKKNAMSPDLHRDMARAFDEIEKQGGNKVIVITGAGDSWCGGDGRHWRRSDEALKVGPLACGRDYHRKEGIGDICRGGGRKF